MNKWKYYIRSESEDDQVIRDWEIDRKRYMSILKYLKVNKRMHEDYCSKSKTKFVAGDKGILIYRKEVQNVQTKQK